MRLLRGLWSRRATLTPLLLVTVAVVAGAVTTLGFAHAAGTSPRLVAPLLLIGVAALPASGRELAERRRGELAIARLRGVHGLSLWLLLAIEPFLVLLAGAVAGFLIGLLGARLAAAGWLTGHPSAYDGSLVLVSAAAVVVGLVAVLVGAASALREPLGDQVRSHQRPRPAGTLAIFVTLLVFAGAAVALYRATNKATGRDDWVVLAGPAMLGLAAGQLAVWTLRLLARWSTGRTSRSGLPTFLAVRRLARTPAVGDPLRLLVASAVVAALAMTGTHAVDGFTDTGARLDVGSAYQFTLKGRVVDALDASRTLDPSGRHLMAAMLVADSPDASQRQAFVDTTRYAAVVAPSLRGTPAAGAAVHLRGLRTTEAPILVSGNSLSVRVTGIRGPAPRDARARVLEVDVDYVDDSNVTSTATVTMRLTTSATQATGSARLPGCAQGCSPVSFEVGQVLVSPRDQIGFHADQGNLQATLAVLRLGDRNLLADTWSHKDDISVGFGLNPGHGKGSITQNGGTAQVSVPAGTSASFVPKALTQPLPVLATRGLSFSGKPATLSTGGDLRPARIVARVPALPLVAAGGTLSDLSSALVGAAPTVPSAHVFILANASTPTAMLTTLRHRYGAPSTVATMARTLEKQVVAAQARVYVLMAGFCLLVALLVLAAWAGRQRIAQRETAAGLRVVGVRPEQVRRAGWLELVLLAVASVVAAALGAVVAVHGLLGHLPLVRTPAFAVPLDAAVTWWPLVVAGLVLVVAWLGLGSRVVRTDAAPATLREGEA